MKIFSHFFLAFILWMIASCATPPSEEVVIKDSLAPDAPAVVMQAEYTLLSYGRLIDPETDQAFIDEDVRQAMAQCSAYQRILTKSEDAMYIDDTLANSELIPFYADLSELTTVFQDGQSEYIQEIDLDPETNPLLALHTSPMDLSCLVAKVELKDGYIRTYNPTGDLLYESAVEMPDYSEYIEELKENFDVTPGTKAPMKKDINWLRHKMAEESPVTKGVKSDSYNIYETTDGMVVLEQSIIATKAAENYYYQDVLFKRYFQELWL